MAAFIPDSELDTTILFMMSDEQGSLPRMFMLANYRPRDQVVVLVPLNQDTRVQTRNGIGRLTDLYQTGGAPMVVEALSNTLGIDCEFYVKFDRVSFTGFASLFRDVRVNIPADFSAGGLTLRAGEHFLGGGDLFLYMNFANFPEFGDDFNLALIGQAMTAFINVLNNANTNLTRRDYFAYQRALYHTSMNAINPATVYIPSGAREAHEFVISNRSIANIHERFGLA
jgi:hypothetical protein